MLKLPADCSAWNLRSDGWILVQKPYNAIYKKTAVRVLTPESDDNTWPIICKERAGEESGVPFAQTYSIICREHACDEIKASFWHVLDWRGPSRERTVIRSLTHAWIFDRTLEGFEGARRVVGAARVVLDKLTDSDFDLCLKHCASRLPASQLSSYGMDEMNESGAVARQIHLIAFGVVK